MRRSKNFKAKRLAGAMNALAFKGGQNVNFTVGDGRYNFGSGKFYITMLMKATAGTALHMKGTGCEIRYGFGTANALDNYLADTNGSIGGEPFSGDVSLNNYTRVGVSRNGDNELFCYNNNRKISAGTFTGQFNFNACYLGSKTDGTNFFTGIISEVLILKGYEPTEEEVDRHHYTHIVPDTWAPYVVTHYRLNADAGSQILDAVDRYNVTRSTAVTRNEPSITGYSGTEYGESVDNDNRLMQTAWNSFYNKSKRGQWAWDPPTNAANGFITNFSDVTYPAFTIVVAWLGKDLSEGGAVYPNNTGHIFVNQNSGGYDANTIGYRADGNTVLLLNGLGGNTVLNATLYQKDKIYVSILKLDGGKLYSYHNGPDQIPYIGPSSGISGHFDGIYFSGNGLVRGAVPIVKFAFVDRVTSFGEDVSLYHFLTSDEYKTQVGGIQIDVDFGDVFVSGGNYFARDSSGNNRHARLQGFNPAISKARYVNRISGIPRRKGLMFVHDDNKYIKVSGFNPTKEKGYTHIVGFLLDGDRDPLVNEALFSKVEPGVHNKGLVFNSNRSFVPFDQTTTGSVPNYWYEGYTRSAALDSYRFVIWKATDNTSELEADGVRLYYNYDATGGYLRGFDEINGDLTIGGGGFGVPLNGFMFFFGIWKGILTEAQVQDVMTGRVTPKLLADCEIYLNFDAVKINGSTYTIKDYSGKNRTAQLVNYTLAQVTPGDPEYLLFDLD